MENTNTENRTRTSLWIQAIRPFSLTATLIPVLMGAMIALALYPGNVNWYLMFIVALGSPFFQLAGNLLSEYFDFKNNVDRKETFGSSRILVDGLMKPKSILFAGLLALTILFTIGMALVYFRGLNMFYIGMIGLLASYFYTKLKYNALGDLMIFLCFGPLMTFGTFFAITGTFDMLTEIALISLPVGFLVTAILHANNTRDILHDTKAGIKTLASVIGIKGAKFEYYFLVAGAFLSVVIFISAGILPLWSLLVFLSLPLAMKNIKAFSVAEVEKPELIRMLDVSTAQHHMMFGLLYCISIFIQYFSV